ncbi:hypothetical protein D8770_02235 [Methylobacterium sp. DB1607]|jgi:hypothetical protein|nr:hypothetical protein [Methylobacterium sp. DB1607]
MTGDLPPPPIVCILSEHRQGSLVELEAEIRSSSVGSGTYRLLVTKQGLSGSAQVSQQSDFSISSDSIVRLDGPRFLLEPDGRYRARLSVRIGSVEYMCEREGPDVAIPL